MDYRIPAFIGIVFLFLGGMSVATSEQVQHFMAGPNHASCNMQVYPAGEAYAWKCFGACKISSGICNSAITTKDEVSEYKYCTCGGGDLSEPPCCHTIFRTEGGTNNWPDAVGSCERPACPSNYGVVCYYHTEEESASCDQD